MKIKTWSQDTPVSPLPHPWKTFVHRFWVVFAEIVRVYVFHVKYPEVIPGRDMGSGCQSFGLVLGFSSASHVDVDSCVLECVCARMFLGCRPETQLVSRVCECKFCTRDSQDLVQVYTPAGSICSSNSSTSWPTDGITAFCWSHVVPILLFIGILFPPLIPVSMGISSRL